MDIIDIWVNCPTAEVADKIADKLLEKRLIACANRHAPIESRYRWQGKIECEMEVPLLMKTRVDLFDPIVTAVQSIHPYDVPSIIGVPVSHVNEDYATWVMEETKDASL